MKRIIPRFFAVLFLVSVLAAAAFASSPPVPQSKAEALGSLKDEIRDEKEKKESLESDLKAAEKKLEDVKKQLIEIGRSVRDNEQMLLMLESRIETLDAKKKVLEDRLENDYENVSDLLLALQRIRRVPPEALIVRPGMPLETAQSALILRTVLPAIHDRARALSDDLKALAKLEDRLKKNRFAALQTKFILEKKYDKIETLTVERQSHYKTVNRDYQKTVESLDRLAREAASLEDLVQELEKQRLAEKQRREKALRKRRMAGARAAPGKKPGSLSQARMAAIPRTLGRPQLPVSGPITTNYGQTDKIGAASQGIRIRGTSGGLVVAPLNGRVQFAGEFKNYGQLIILEHADGYHSLIGGMESVTVSVGERLEAGEPLGKLSLPPSPGETVTLYYELRHKGRPVDPSRKFANIKT